MERKTKNILIITSAVIVLGVATYFYLKNRSRNKKVSDKTEKTAGKTVSNYEDLKQNLPQFIPDGAIKQDDAKTTKDGQQLTEKIYPYQFLATVDPEGKGIDKFAIYYYADGDFRVYGYLKKDAWKKSTWVASGKWIDDNGMKVFVEPKEYGEQIGLKKGTYEGINIKDLLSKMVKQPVGYYDTDLKKFIV